MSACSGIQQVFPRSNGLTCKEWEGLLESHYPFLFCHWDGILCLQLKGDLESRLRAVEADIREEDQRVDGIDKESKRLTDAMNKLKNKYAFVKACRCWYCLHNSSSHTFPLYFLSYPLQLIKNIMQAASGRPGKSYIWKYVSSHLSSESPLTPGFCYNSNFQTHEHVQISFRRPEPQATRYSCQWARTISLGKICRQCHLPYISTKSLLAQEEPCSDEHQDQREDPCQNHGETWPEGSCAWI